MLNNNYHYIRYYLTYSLIAFGNYCYEAREVGSECEQVGLKGTCKKVNNCPIAIEAIAKTRNHNLLRCGFVDFTEIVCCPILGIDRSPSTINSSSTESLFIFSTNNDNDYSIDDDHHNHTTTEENSSNNEDKTKGRISSSKRKCVLACEKIYKDNNIGLNVTYNILNGEDATKGQFPHMAALGIRDDFGKLEWGKCGASLISSKFLLTAAHCFTSISSNSYNRTIKVRLGIVDVRDDSDAQDIDVKNIILGDYNGISRHNDIALIELKEEVKMTNFIYPACLYPKSDDPLGLIVSGWGITDPTDFLSRSNILQFAKLIPVPVTQCNISILAKNRNTIRVIIGTQICAISKESDACMGDSGGPLQLESNKGGFEIVGIVSYGISCGPTVPGIYTRVSAYLDWIEEHVWP